MMDGDRTLDADDLAPEAAPEAVLQIGDVETLRALSDPTRMRILETMVQRLDPAWSVKELAVAMGVPQTRLYHHMELLAEHGLVRPVERRVVSGIIETRYRVAALSFQLDRSLFSAGSEEQRQAVHETLVTVFDTARHEIETAIHLGLIDSADTAPVERRVLLARGLARLSPTRAAEFRQRLQALEEEFTNDSDADTDGAAYGIVLAVYPMPPGTDLSDD
jgi:DNA-binding transcriptional ArsR family regulator